MLRFPVSPPDGAHEVLPAVRPRWHSSVIGRLQAAADRLLTADRTEIRASLSDVSESLPKSNNRVERLVLHWLLLQFAAEAGDAIHTRAHALAGPKKCTFITSLPLESFVKARTVEPITAFREWVDAYFAALDRIHPLSSANRVAVFLRNHYQRLWPLDTLAERAHVTRTQLTRGFRREYGMSIGEYQQRVRLFQAANRIRQGEKIDAVSLEVGYRSKNKFYRAFARLIGVTPAEFRRLPSSVAEQILDSARLALVAPVPRRSTATSTRHVKAQAADSSRRGRRLATKKTASGIYPAKATKPT